MSKSPSASAKTLTMPAKARTLHKPAQAKSSSRPVSKAAPQLLPKIKTLSTVDTQKKARDLRLRQAISAGLGAWLRFEELSGRQGLFSERYLAMPIAHLLAHNVRGYIEAEFNHPVLAMLGKPGRQPQLDFVVKEHDTEKPILCVETKWADARGVSVDDVVWDCVRLELAAKKLRCESIFILAGKRDTIQRMLSSDPFSPPKKDGKPSLLMSLNGSGRQSVNIKSKAPVSDTLPKILQSYPTVEFATTYICEDGTQIPKKDLPEAYTAVVWHIRPEMEGKRHIFFGKDA